MIKTNGTGTEYLRNHPWVHVVQHETESFTDIAHCLGKKKILECALLLLKWEDTDEFRSKLQTWYLGHILREIRNIFGQISRLDADLGASFEASLQKLPDWGLTRFLAAPETSRHISKFRYNPIEHMQFFRSALLAEQALAGIREPAGRCWTALGDFYLAGDFIAQDTHNPEFSFAAPRLANQTPIDFVSPHAQLVNSMPDCPFQPYETVERNKLCELMETAFAIVRLVSIPATRFFRDFIQVIVARNDFCHPRSYSGSSTASHIGRLLIRNGHLMSAGKMADSLIHESIHALLFIVEILEPFLVTPVQPEPCARSPWSGNLLPIRTYLHACFVWFGLAQFWRLAVNSAGSAEIANPLLDAALLGFQKGNPVDELLPYRHLISPNTFDVAGQLRAELMLGNPA